MDLDLLDTLPPPTISLASIRSWSMSKFIDFPEDLSSGGEDTPRSQSDDCRYPGESRYLPIGPVSQGILIQGSGEYVHPQDIWASSFSESKRRGSTDDHYYHISTDSISNVGTTPSPTSTSGETFLLGDAHTSIACSLDSGPSSITSPNSDGSNSSGPSVYSTSESYNGVFSRLSVPSFSPSMATQSRSHSPLSMYSSPSPLALSATSSPPPQQVSYLSGPDRLLSPFQLADSGPTVNMSDVYSHQSTFDLHTQDVYNLTVPHPFVGFDHDRYSSPLNSSTSYEAELESEFGYCSPFRVIDTELEQALGKRTRISDFVDNAIDRKRARQNSPVLNAFTTEKRKRGRPRKSEQALMTPSQAAASPAATFGDSDEMHQESEDDSDSDPYVPSDDEGGSYRNRGNGRMGSGFGSSGNAEALKELELRANGTYELSASGVFEYSGPTGSRGDQGSVILRRQDRHTTHPVPVPNLTKKTRGRKVPVSGEDPDASSLSGPFEFAGTDAGFSLDSATPRGRSARNSAQDGPSYVQSENLSADVTPQESFKIVSGGIKKPSGERRYVCTVEGCGKCFVRGEHLKRHVRSLHTWEKPHKCPHPGCSKSFSRRDNLGQHVRVHL